MENGPESLHCTAAAATATTVYNAGSADNDRRVKSSPHVDAAGERTATQLEPERQYEYGSDHRATNGHSAAVNGNGAGAGAGAGGRSGGANGFTAAKSSAGDSRTGNDDDDDDDDIPLASMLPATKPATGSGQSAKKANAMGTARAIGATATAVPAAAATGTSTMSAGASKFKRLKRACDTDSACNTGRAGAPAVKPETTSKTAGIIEDDGDDDFPISQLLAGNHRHRFDEKHGSAAHGGKASATKPATVSTQGARTSAKKPATSSTRLSSSSSSSASAPAQKRKRGSDWDAAVRGVSLKSVDKQAGCKRRDGASSTKAARVSKKNSPRSPKSSPSKSKRTGSSSGAEDDSVKWHTLEHSGVVFPPEYEPHGVPLVYDGAEVPLDAPTEEVATFYATKLETDYVKKARFNKNFFAEFRAVMPRELRARIKTFAKCDFGRIHDHLQRTKQEKRNLRPEERKRHREEEAARVARYTVARVDGREEKVGNFRIEPPGLFLGRGEHPLMGKLKRRVMPEDVTLNLGRDAPVPPCPMAGHRWGAIQHNSTATWLAAWKDNVTGNCKYVWLNAASHFKSQSDKDKFENARELSKHVAAIRNRYVAGYRSRDMATRQCSVALYLIDKLALRVGNEKAEDEADTVGCCSLRVEHLQLQPPRTVEFDFLGKDSMRYQNSVEVDELVFRILQEFVRGKRPHEQVFDRLETTQLNDHLKTLMPGLSAKVFRTYNASFTLDRLLRAEASPGKDTHGRVLFYNKANKEVAILCNHQRSLPKTHEAMMGKYREQLQDAQEYLKELKRGIAKAQKQGEGGGRGGAPVTVVQWRRPRAEVPPNTPPVEAKRLRDEAASKPKEKHERAMKLDTMRRAAAQTKERVAKLDTELKTRDTLATVALGTSKINYLDPRITAAWCKRHVVPVERIFAKTLLEKFRWSMDASEDWRFALTTAKQEADALADT